MAVFKDRKIMLYHIFPCLDPLSFLLGRGYLPELFRKIRTYLPELFRQIKTYLPEPLKYAQSLLFTPEMGSLAKKIDRSSY